MSLLKNALSIGTALPVVVVLGAFALGCGDDEKLFSDGPGGTGGTGGQGGGEGGLGGGAQGGGGAGGVGNVGAGGEGGSPACMDLGDPCTQCESQTCPAEYCACYNNGSCGLMATCLAECAPLDDDCIQACWTAYPDGISDGALLVQCAATTCAQACPGFTPLSGCQVCLYSECEPEMNECISNPECTALLFCLDECASPGCEQGCYTAYPDGLADAGPVGECLQDSCVADCS